MADKRSDMAVATDNQMNNQPLKDSVPKEDMDQRSAVNTPRLTNDGFPKKKGAFKITSIKLNDTDGDSMDDLDESHTEITEDASSEILDMSKNTDVDQDALSEDFIMAAPLPISGGTDQMVVIKDASGESLKDGKEKTGADMHSRFRVVKIETKEPFHRGRWICHDFLDTQPPISSDRSETKLHEDANSGSSSAGSSIHYIHGVDDPSKNPLLSGATGTIPISVSQSDLQTPVNYESFQPIQPAPNSATSQQPVQAGGQPSQSYYTDSSQNQGLSKPLCQTMPQSYSHQSLNPDPVSDSIQATATIQGQSNVPQGNVDNVGNVGANIQQLGGVYLQDPNTVQNVDSQSGITGSASVLQSTYPPNIQSTSQIAGGIGTLPSSSTAAAMSGALTDSYPKYMQHAGGQVSKSTGGTDTATSQSSDVNSTNTSSIPASTGDQASQRGTASERPVPTSFMPLTEVLDKDLNVIQNAALLSPLAAAVGEMQSPHEEQSLRRSMIGHYLLAHTAHHGSSTVAIDNKIEQAMDLVKSHLMFAVREEVEVLKEQISELVERNNQLEYENSILRATASQETLNKLSQPRQPPASSS